MMPSSYTKRSLGGTLPLSKQWVLVYRGYERDDENCWGKIPVKVGPVQTHNILTRSNTRFPTFIISDTFAGSAVRLNLGQPSSVIGLLLLMALGKKMG